MRVRIAWGGGAERMWRAVVGVSQGTVSEPAPLGIEADEPGSMWLDANPMEVQTPGDDRSKVPSIQLSGHHLVVRQRSPRTYDGVDLLVTAPLSAALWLQLAANDSQKQPPWISIPLTDLVGNTYGCNLDERGNRLMVRRAPGDDLQVSVAGRSMVFAPGSLLKCQVQPHLLPVEAGAKLRIKAQLLVARTTSVLWSTEQAFTAGEPATLPFEVRLDRGEGVYDLVLTATHAGGLRWQSVTPALGHRAAVAERRIQVVVIGRDPPAEATAGGSPWSRVVEIDPANPRWWERFSKVQQLPRLARFWKGPSGNGHVQPLQHPLGPLVQLRPSVNPRDVAWEAYPLPTNRPGTPHLLEIEYPSNVPQTMGISIIEPNAAGAVMPVGLDSGVDLADEVAADPSRPHWQRHRLVFWPRTKTPMVLITNRRDKTPAVYGKIRVLAGDVLPRAFPARAPRPERLLAAYLDRPLLPETFSASDPPGSLSDLSVDDWITFYEAGTRAVEYLNYAGHNGLMVAVLADGSTIYPSRLVEPTPRYDTGMFLPTGQDPVRKDVLEMLFQLFDREGLQLIPALEFAAPLPELEAILRGGGPECEGMCWVGADGAAWTDRHQPVRGLAPYYNVLHPRVQEAMLAVVREVVGLYAQHSSFAGLGIQLSAHGYAQLPGPEWGLDEATVARFQQDTQISVPGAGVGSGRFAQRAAFLTGEARKEWLEWRAEQLSRFYRRIAAELAAIRPHARLYLAGAESLSGEELEQELQPTLSRRSTMSETLLHVGIDSRRYGEDRGIVLLRPERIVPQMSLAARAVDLEISQMPDLDRHFADLAVPGSLFFHPPQELRLPSFDERSPFRPTYTWLVSQPVPSGQQNRRRFVHSLATIDSQVIFDGGWELPLGQEDSLRELIAAYRQLPAARFERLSEQPGAGTAQPVTVRYCTRANYTYLYAVNDAAFPSVLRVGVDAPAGCQVEELSGLRRVAPLGRDAQGSFWSVELAPYDLVAVRFTLPNVRFHAPRSNWPGEIRSALEMRISELGERVQTLRGNPPLLQVLENPGFEAAPSHANPIPGWYFTASPEVNAQLDATNPHLGGRAVRLTSRGPTASLVSRPFDAPRTGRLCIWVWLRTTAEDNQPPLRLALEGRHQGRDFLRFAPFGRAPASGSHVPPIGVQWTQVGCRINDLPLEGLSQLQVRFDLLGPGEVWIDDVQLGHLVFEQKEVVELYRLLSPADVKLQSGQVGDCIRLLESYWAQFLVSNVSQPAVPVTRSPGHRPHRSSGDGSGEPQRTGFLERMKGFLPDRLRF